MEEKRVNGTDMYEDFEAMLNESLTPPTKGSLVKGIIVNISDTDIYVNFGYKTEGVVDINEFKKDGSLTASIGDEVELEVVAVSGGGAHVRLSKKNINLKHDIDEVVKSINKDAVTVKIVKYDEKNKKFIGKHGEVEIHILEHQIDHKNSMKEPSYYVGKTFECKVLKFDGKSKTALASRKQYLIDKQKLEKENFLNSLNEGDIVKGVVKSIKEFGAFIGLGPVDGFIAKENVSWGRVGKIEKHINLGETVEAKILKIDRENGKIDLGIKQLKINPWESAKSKYPVNSEVKGTIVVKLKNGYIVEVEKGVEAFIPNEEVSWIKKGNISLKKGDLIVGRVLDIDEKREKLVISIKALQENPWDILKKEHPEGSVVKGKIKGVTDFGIFVDFGAHVDGLVRKGDISWIEEEIDLHERFKVGDEIEAKILSIDPEKERIALGIKQLEKNPWKEIDKLYPSGKVVDAVVTAVDKDGVTVSLTKGIKGYIPLKELDEGKVNPLELYKEGSQIKASVLKADAKNKVILLSIRKYKMDSERTEVKEFMKSLQKQNDDSFSLGALLKDKIKQ
ncbi:MAG: S1 RNA-binding domain-containing protein [Deferribacterales bacterium]